MSVYLLTDPLDVEKYKKACYRHLKLGHLVELKERLVRRTNAQNSYIHLCIAYFASQYGCTERYAKEEFYKRAANPDLYIVRKMTHGGWIEDTRHSSELSKEDMMESITRFLNWSASEAGIRLPEPDDLQFQKEAIREIERCKDFL